MPSGHVWLDTVADGLYTGNCFTESPVSLFGSPREKDTANNEQSNSLNGFVPNAFIEDMFLPHNSQLYKKGLYCIVMRPFIFLSGMTSVQLGMG